MARFMVSYDLHGQRNYQPLWDGLNSKGGKKLLESLYVIRLNNTAAEVRQWLNGLIDSDDAVAVIELKPADWATTRAKRDGIEWLKQHL